MLNTAKDESRVDKAARFAKIWWKSRADAGKSQEYMAMALGVSKKTIQNWEKGISSPSLFQSTEWFNLLGQNPIHYYLTFLYPDMFERLTPDVEDERIEHALLNLIKDLTPVEKRQLLYLIAGEHGSSWYSLLQLFTAHCHTSMRSRVAVARLIMENFEIDSKTGDLVCPENVMPDVEMLRHAIKKGKTAAENREAGYSLQYNDIEAAVFGD